LRARRGTRTGFLDRQRIAHPLLSHRTTRVEPVHLDEEETSPENSGYVRAEEIRIEMC
jgi:hypothetical protein